MELLFYYNYGGCDLGFDVSVGLVGFFLILISFGLMCLDSVAQDGGLILGICLLLLGVALFYSSIFLL